METTSSSSDSDHHSYDTVKLLNSKKDLIKLSQIVKIRRVLNQYKDHKLELVDRNLIKGIFVRRPTKPFVEDHAGTKIENAVDLEAPMISKSEAFKDKQVSLRDKVKMLQKRASSRSLVKALTYKTSAAPIVEVLEENDN